VKIKLEELLYDKFEKRLQKQSKGRMVNIVQQKEIHDAIDLVVSKIKIKFAQGENSKAFQEMILSNISAKKTELSSSEHGSSI